MTTQEIEVEMLIFECLICHPQSQVRAHLISAAPWCCITPMLVTQK